MKKEKNILIFNVGSSSIKYSLFKDSELIGIPLRITIGEENLKAGKLEIKLRRTNKVLKIDRTSVLENIITLSKEIN